MNHPQKLEDIATAYWYSEVLFTAVETDVFSILTEDMDAAAVGERLGFPTAATARFLNALITMGFIEKNRNLFRTSAYAARYLIPDRPDYQGHSILWRKNLQSQWRELSDILAHGGRYRFDDDGEEAINDRFYHYSLAMNDIAHYKTNEILDLFEYNAFHGDILDLGCGFADLSMGFLSSYPDTKTTLMDMEQVLQQAKKRFPANLKGRICCHPGDILSPWDFGDKTFHLILCSNIIHAFNQSDNEILLAKAANALQENGVILIHDFFPEHQPQKAAMMDLNMLINTYNGGIHKKETITKILNRQGLAETVFLPLKSDTAVLLAAKTKERLTAVVKEVIR